MTINSRFKKRIVSPICIRITLTIIIAVGLYAIIVNWRYAWTIWEVKDGNIETVICPCVAISQNTNYEIYGHQGGRARYDFVLDSGTVVGCYKDTINKALSVTNVDELNFLIGRELKFAYIPKKIFSNGGFVLLSIHDNDQIILSEKEVYTSFYDRLLRVILVTAILWIFALLFVLVPLGIGVCRKYKKYKRKMRRIKNKNRKPSVNQDEQRSKNGSLTQSGDSPNVIKSGTIFPKDL